MVNPTIVRSSSRISINTAPTGLSEYSGASTCAGSAAKSILRLNASVFSSFASSVISTVIDSVRT